MVKVILSLMKNVLKPLGKIVLVLLKLAAPASVTDTSTYKKKSQLGIITFINSKADMEDFTN